MKSIKNRIAEPTPPFFKKLVKIGGCMIGISALILAAPVTIPGLVLPAAITTVATYLGTAGVVLAGTSKLTTNDETTGPFKDK